MCSTVSIVGVAKLHPIFIVCIIGVKIKCRILRQKTKLSLDQKKKTTVCNFKEEPSAIDFFVQHSYEYINATDATTPIAHACMAVKFYILENPVTYHSVTSEL